MLLTPTDPRARVTPLPRAAWAFAALAAGLALGRYAPSLPAPAWFAAACLAAMLAALLRGRPCRAGLLAAAAAFGAGWFTLRILEVPPGSLFARLGEGESLVTVIGTVLDQPRIIPPEDDVLARQAFTADPRQAMTLRVEQIETEQGMQPVRGVLYVRCAETPLRAGDRVRMMGNARPIPPPMNPGEGDRRLTAAQDGVAGYLRAPNTSLIERLPDDDTLLGRLERARLRWLAAARARARALLLGADGAPTESRALLAALFLGEQGPALREVRSAFTRLGLAHVLAISGFHLAVMAAVALVLLRLGGDGGWLEPLIVAILVASYLVILPVSAPVWRSGLMVLALLAADALGRRYDRLALLSWAAVLLLLWRPMDLWSIGFQLSFGLVAVLVTFGPVMYARLWGVPLRGVRRAPPEGAWGWCKEQGRHLVAANLLCSLTAAPLVAYHTGLVSLLAVAAGIVVLPLIVALLGAGYVVLLAGVLVPGAAGLAGGALESLSAATVWVVRTLDAAPGTSVRLPPVTLAWVVAATLLIFYWVARGRRRDKAAWAATVLVGAWLTVELWAGGRLAPGVALRIDTLAVGDGTCHLVRAGDDAILWDCGSMIPGVGRVTVPRAAFALGLSRIPVAVVSHPNLDHFNGLLDAAEALGLETVYVGEVFMEQSADVDGPESYVLEGLAARGVEVRVLAAGDTIVLGDLRMEILSPPRGATWVLDNDRSLVGRIEVRTPGAGVRSLLLTGDIEHEAMEHLEREHRGLRTTIVEAPHHGSARPRAFEFVFGLDPLVVLQSTGPDRLGDERWDGVKVGREWYTTAADGAAWAEVRRDGSVRSGALRR